MKTVLNTHNTVYPTESSYIKVVLMRQTVSRIFALLPNKLASDYYIKDTVLLHFMVIKLNI